MTPMHSHIWRGVGRWLLALVVCVPGVVPAFIFLEISPALKRKLVSWIDVLGFRLPVEIGLFFAGLLIVSAALCLWILPSALAVGFALHAPIKSRIRWGLTLYLLFSCPYLWLVNAPGATVASKVVAAVVAILVLSSVLISLRREYTAHPPFLVIALGAIALTVPGWISCFRLPPEPPDAQKVWSVALQEDAWPGMNTGSTFDSRRQIVIAGDRLLVSFDAGSAPYEGTQPMSNYRLLSLNLETGAIVNSRAFTGKWGSMPLLYATNDGRAILNDKSLESLNPDLTDAGPQFAPDRGRVDQMSPDGSTMAWETMPGSTLLDSRTLNPLPRHLDESVPTSVSNRAVLTNNTYWYGRYPNDHSFVTLTDETGEHLIFHGECGGRPEFLTDEKVLVAGCGNIRIIDTHGNLLQESRSAGDSPSFAGASQDGKRFAMEFSETRGDPPMPLYDHFVIYETETVKPLAIVRVSDLPEFSSWSAISPDGKLFAAGNPNRLSLYRVP
jgi:hypothetical protein